MRGSSCCSREVETGSKNQLQTEREREREEREKLGTKVRPTDTRLPPVTNKMLLGSFGLFLLSLKYVSKIFYTFIQIPLSEISLLNNLKPFALP